VGGWQPRSAVRVGRRTLPAFVAFGLAGVLAGVVAGALVGAGAGLDAGVLVTIGAGGVGVTAVGLVGQAAARGTVNLVAFREAGLVTLVTALSCRALGASVPAGLDAVAVALALVLAGGRLGCLAAGCCHGRPVRHGVRYGQEQVALGLPEHLAGVRLAPVAALEATGLVLLTPAAVVLALAGPPGAAFGVLASGYAILRAVLEPHRGDTGRPRRCGLTTAQWAAAVTGVAVAAAAAAGALPAWTAAFGAAAAVAVAATRLGRSPLLTADHLAELAAAAARTGPPVVTTSLGLRISHGTVEEPHGSLDHYTLSRDRPLGRAETRALATTLRALRHPDRTVVVLPGRPGTVHLAMLSPGRVSGPSRPSPAGPPDRT
jgi:Prolipoprotein diacylglyceryl transferase